MHNRRVILTSRPTGVAQKENFAVETADATAPGEGEIVVRNSFLSVEPAMRGWIADVNNYAQAVPIGSVMRALAVGIVVTSRHPDYAEGDALIGWFGWQEVATVGADAVVRRIAETDLPLSLALGVLGLNGVTAYLALTRVGEPKAGDVVVVSTAAGSVGSAVGQIARIMGCRTIGIAGGADKARQCVETFGYDEGVDYKAPDFAERIAAACADGVNVYFDNTAGVISDTVMQHLAIGARIVVCGTASVQNWSPPPVGPRVERQILVKRARMQGFVIFDHMDEYDATVAKLAGWVRSGELRYVEEVLDGIEQCPDALAGLYRGENMGKRLIRL